MKMEESEMNMLSRQVSMSAAKAAIVATAMFFTTVPSQAQMACSISLEFTKGGFVVGGSGGSGTLTCDGQSYPLRVGGLRAGLVIGLSKDHPGYWPRNIFLSFFLQHTQKIAN